MSPDKTASTAGADVTSNNPSTAARSLTKRQQFWLDHLRRCDADRIPTKTCAQQHGLESYAYLRHLYTELSRAETVEEIETLLPGNITTEHIGQ